MTAPAWTSEELRARLRLLEGFEGDLDTSRLARLLYGQDASIYEEDPLGVARPRHAADCARLVRFASENAIPLIPRAGGTSLAGQCVGRGLVVDVSRYMNRIVSIDPENRTAAVEPGVIQDDLNDAAAAHDLMFAPDTSTSKQANIGGMIGNNSCGAYSILYGTTREHVIEAQVLLGDGSEAVFGPVDDDMLRAKAELDTLEGVLYRDLLRLVGEHRDRILADFPKPQIQRRNMGYPLDLLARSRPFDPDGPPFNLARFVCGTEGTLCLVTGARVRLTPRPKKRLLMCAHFRDVDEACRATVECLHFQPAAVELMDGVLLEATRNNREQTANRFWVEGDPGAVLAIEFRGDESSNPALRASELADHLRARGLGYAFPVIDPKNIARVWELRKAGLGLLTGIPGDRKPSTGIEDCAVTVEDLPAYIRDATEACKRHGCDCAYYGHASVGVIHLRPMLNLKDPEDLRRFEAILDEIAALVKRYGGSLSGEHGDGRLRGPYVKRMLSAEVYELIREVKALFDPAGIFNPHKIIEAPAVTEALRAHPGRPTPEIETVFDWSSRLGYVRAAESCNGAGFCRQSPGRGTMCPSYMVSGEEAYSTRGRANVLRRLLTSGDPEAAWTDPDLAAVMDTCLSCKACATECPSSVDMARLKAEMLQKIHDRRSAPLRSRLLGHYAAFARLARIAPGIASRAVNLRPVKRLLGVAVERTVPPYARQTFAAWFRAHIPHERAGTLGEVVLFNDEFTNYTDPETGMAAVRVLEAAGYRVILPAALDSGRTQISKGFLRSARSVMEKTVSRLAPYARRNLPVVGVEPSALLGFRDEAPDLVRPDRRADAEQVRNAAVCFEEFVAERAARGEWDLPLAALSPNRILLHGHCHQKALSGTSPTEAALHLIPDVEVTVLNSGCCGMAGSFGYEREHYEMSMQIGEQILFPAIRRHPDAWICAAGTSCRHQILDGTGRRARHPAELLAAALAAAPES
jgi:FAD/FMN-containing dehydrogenase/Fe-S oxidoreductase